MSSVILMIVANDEAMLYNIRDTCVRRMRGRDSASPSLTHREKKAKMCLTMICGKQRAGCLEDEVKCAVGRASEPV
jgi:hypothetical protein